VDRACETAPESPLAQRQAEIDAHFGGETLGEILESLRASDSDFARETRAALAKGSPLSMGCTVEMLHRLRPEATIRDALAQEYRFTFRAMERGDFLEGIRAAIIDKDRAPRWSHELDDLAEEDVAAMLAPLDAQALTFGEEAAT
jgi:enoyl-CoA hydratase